MPVLTEAIRTAPDPVRALIQSLERQFKVAVAVPFDQEPPREAVEEAATALDLILALETYQDTAHRWGATDAQIVAQLILTDAQIASAHGDPRRILTNALRMLGPGITGTHNTHAP